MLITRCAQPEDAEALATLRAELWPAASIDEHRAELLDLMRNSASQTGTFVAIDAVGDLVGFAEASVRRDYVNGCETSPVAFLEGLYVRPQSRGQGLGSKLCLAVAQWGVQQNCREFASDADISNKVSHAFHQALGFVETERVVFYRKLL